MGRVEEHASSCLELSRAATCTGKKKSRDSYRSKATAQVNDRYFISDVTSYAAGNFTAGGSGFFKGWTYNDVGASEVLFCYILFGLYCLLSSSF